MNNVFSRASIQQSLLVFSPFAIKASWDYRLDHSSPQLSKMFRWAQMAPHISQFNVEKKVVWPKQRDGGNPWLGNNLQQVRAKLTACKEKEREVRGNHLGKAIMVKQHRKNGSIHLPYNHFMKQFVLEWVTKTAQTHAMPVADLLALGQQTKHPHLNNPPGHKGPYEADLLRWFRPLVPLGQYWLLSLAISQATLIDLPFPKRALNWRSQAYHQRPSAHQPCLLPTVLYTGPFEISESWAGEGLSMVSANVSDLPPILWYRMVSKTCHLRGLPHLTSRKSHFRPLLLPWMGCDKGGETCVGLQGVFPPLVASFEKNYGLDWEF